MKFESVCVLADSIIVQNSAYAPQLAVKLSLSSTQTNLIGAAGNGGVYLSGPFIGMAVDRKGPRAVLVFSAITLGVGCTYYPLSYVTQISTSDHGKNDALICFGLLFDPQMDLSEHSTTEVNWDCSACWVSED